MNTLLLVLLMLLVVILALVGIVGAILPALPGPPLCWVAMLLTFLVLPHTFGASTLWTMAGLTAIAQVIDYVAPIWLTKAGGGSKAAITGSTVGMILGLFYMPLGLIMGPLVGAFVGEMMSTNRVGKAVRVALMSFVAFLLTTGLKLVLCLLMTYYVACSIVEHCWAMFSR